MLTRFELFVILRNQVADRKAVRRSIAVEATMEALAAATGADRAEWGAAGLATGLDAELSRNNPERRGEIARELFTTEGGDPEVGAALRDRIATVDADRLTRLAAALVVAETLVDRVYDELEDASLDSVDAAAIAHRLRRAAELRGDAGASHAIACAARIGVAIDRAAALCVDAMRSAREDLRL